MSEDQLKAFLEAVKADAGLQEQLKAAGDADAVVAIAATSGFVISVGELAREAQAEISKDAIEMDDDELERVSGGINWDPCQLYSAWKVSEGGSKISSQIGMC